MTYYYKGGEDVRVGDRYEVPGGNQGTVIAQELGPEPLRAYSHNFEQITAAKFFSVCTLIRRADEKPSETPRDFGPLPPGMHEWICPCGETSVRDDKPIQRAECRVCGRRLVGKGNPERDHPPVLGKDRNGREVRRGDRVRGTGGGSPITVADCDEHFFYDHGHFMQLTKVCAELVTDEKPPHDFHEGDRVRITRGFGKDLTGIVTRDISDVGKVAVKIDSEDFYPRRFSPADLERITDEKAEQPRGTPCCKSWNERGEMCLADGGHDGMHYNGKEGPYEVRWSDARGYPAPYSILESACCALAVKRCHEGGEHRWATTLEGHPKGFCGDCGVAKDYVENAVSMERFREFRVIAERVVREQAPNVGVTCDVVYPKPLGTHHTASFTCRLELDGVPATTIDLMHFCSLDDLEESIKSSLGSMAKEAGARVLRKAKS